MRIFSAHVPPPEDLPHLAKGFRRITVLVIADVAAGVALVRVPQLETSKHQKCTSCGVEAFDGTVHRLDCAHVASAITGAVINALHRDALSRETPE